MKRELILNGRRVAYEWTAKRVKNVNIRIRRNGVLSVSAPVGLSLSAVEAVLRKKGDWICAGLDRVRSRPKEKVQAEYGDTVWLFGNAYRLSVVSGAAERSGICGDTLFLSVRKGADEAACRRAFLKWKDGFFRDSVLSLCQSAYAAFRGRGIAYPEIAFRMMKARWGSCLFRKKKLIFNRRLIEVPIEGVEYVVYHEFAHLSEPNHSRRFYAVLDEVLPDWREKKKILERYE